MPFFSPKFFAEWRAFIVGIAASNFCPSLLECTASSMSKWWKMESRTKRGLRGVFHSGIPAAER
jgi:hypothetical protein